MSDLRSLLRAVREISDAAGEVVLQHYAAGVASTEKADRSPVTAADHASSEFICEQLARLDPGVTVVSEEGAAEDLTRANRFWLVDPLDGTKEFLKRTGEFTINIALVEGGQPVLGVVYVPVSGTSYFAARQEGAYAAARAGNPVMIRTRRADPGQLAVVASRDHAGPLVTRLLARLPGASTLSMGSSLKFCLVAEGRADLYLRDVPTMEWDTAAAHCVVNEAGGALLTLENETLSYGKPELRNPAIITVGDSALPWRTYLQ